MRDLSLQILDLVQNSINARAGTIRIGIAADTERDLLEITITDDGQGMDPEFAKTIDDPFVTSRKTRKVGLGVPLLKAAAERSEGSARIESAKGKGTVASAEFRISHIDRPPLGDPVETLVSLIAAWPNLRFILTMESKNGSFELDTRDIKNGLGSVPVNSYEVLDWIKDYVSEGLKRVFGGVLSEIVG